MVSPPSYPIYFIITAMRRVQKDTSSTRFMKAVAAALSAGAAVNIWLTLSRFPCSLFLSLPCHSLYTAVWRTSTRSTISNYRSAKLSGPTPRWCTLSSRTAVHFDRSPLSSYILIIFLFSLSFISISVCENWRGASIITDPPVFMHQRILIILFNLRLMN